MTEQFTETSFEHIEPPTPQELYDFGVLLDEVVTAQKPGGSVEQIRGELNEDYEMASVDLVKIQAAIAENQKLIEEILTEIADVIDSMSNDDAMLPDNEPSAQALIQSRTEVLYSRLRRAKKEKFELASRIKILSQDMVSTSEYTDQNRRDEHRLAEQQPILRQEIGRLALAMDAIRELSETRSISPRYAERYKYTPKANFNIDDLHNLGLAPGEQYTTTSVSVAISMPVAASVEPPPASSDSEQLIRALPPVRISPKTQNKFLQPVTNKNRK